MIVIVSALASEIGQILKKTLAAIWYLRIAFIFIWPIFVARAENILWFLERLKQNKLLPDLVHCKKQQKKSPWPVIPFRILRGPLFHKPVTGQELFFCFVQQPGSKIFWPFRDYNCPNSYTVAWDEQAQTCYILHDFQKLMNDEEFSV